MAGDPAYLRDLLWRIDFPMVYETTEDPVEQLEMFAADLVRTSKELSSVRGIGRVEGTRQVFHMGESHRFFARGALEIKELDFTSEAVSAILQLLEIGFVYNVEQKAFVAEGML